LSWLFPTFYLTNEGHALKEQYQWKQDRNGKGRRSKVIERFQSRCKRPADLDNFNKLSLDALTGIA
jgi:hypothetical protein